MFFECSMFREESILFRAKQVLGIKGSSEPNLKRSFHSLITRYHPDTGGPHHEGQVRVIIEAYKVLKGEIKPWECNLLENDEIVSSLLPEGVLPFELGIKYEDWLKKRFYDFCRP